MNDKKNNENTAFTWDDIEAQYDYLKILAHKVLSKQTERFSWVTTAFFHESLRRLFERNDLWTYAKYKSKKAFINAYHKAMDHAIIDRIRKDSAKKRPSKASTISIDDFFYARRPVAFIKENPEKYLIFKQTINEIEKDNNDLALVIKYRFVHGMNLKEISATTHISYGRVRELFSQIPEKLKNIIPDDN